MKTTETTPINTEAFMALSNIAFSSVERLATLNLNATRAVIDNTLAASATALKTSNDSEKQELLASTPTAVTNSALAYVQGVQEIAADTQQQVIKLVSFYLSEQGNAAPIAAWTKGFDVFKSFGQQLTKMAEANTRATVEASDRVTRSVAASAKKVA